MGCVFHKVHQRLLGGVCLGVVILTHGGCASLVFDELSDQRDGGGGSGGNGSVPISGAKFGSGEDQIVYGAVVDGEGQIVMAGATLDKNMQELGCESTGKGGLDMFVTWVNPDDMAVQCPTSRLLGGLNSDVPLGIAADPKSGGVGIVGFFMSEFNCGSGILNSKGGRDLVVATFVGNSCFWQQSFGDDQDQEGQAIAFDSMGAAYVGGRFKGTLDFQPPLTNSDPVGSDAFVAKFPFGGGNPSWSIHGAGPGDQEVQAIAVRAEDTIIVGGRFSEMLDFNCPAPLVTQDPANDGLFVAFLKNDPTPCTKLVKIAEGPPKDKTPISLAVGADGDIFIAGGFQSRTLFPDDPKCKQVNDTQAEDLFVAKLDLNGDCQWSRRYGDVNPMAAEHQRASAVAVDAASNVYVTGEFNGSITFGPNSAMQSIGLADTFALKLDSAGEHVWSKALGGSGNDYGKAILLDGSGKSVFVVGSFVDGSLTIGNETFTPSSSDVFVAKLAR